MVDHTSNPGPDPGTETGASDPRKTGRLRIEGAALAWGVLWIVTAYLAWWLGVRTDEEHAFTWAVMAGFLALYGSICLQLGVRQGGARDA